MHFWQGLRIYIISHEESIRAVAKRFEIHPSTFHGRLNGQHGPQMGRPSILSVEMETMIAGLLMELNDFPSLETLLHQ